MGLFKRQSPQNPAESAKPSPPPVVMAAGAPIVMAAGAPAATPVPMTASGVPDLSAELKRQLAQANARVFAYSDLVKQVDCQQCGGPKQLPTKTAYVYCDYCGALTDYDFRLANFGTHAALTNQVFAYLSAPVRPAVDIAIATGNKDRYRQLMTPVFAEWTRQCPQANSPRCISDSDFFAQQVTYQVESNLFREFDTSTHQVTQQLVAATRALQKIPQPDGTYLVSDGIWQVAALYKQQMEQSYDVAKKNGIMALDPEGAPVPVWLKMEYSVFCQNWLPSIPKADARRFVEFFGLSDQYAPVKLTDPQLKKCAGCGDELKTVPGARQVICESCGRKLDIAGGEVPCRNCGASLSFPVGTDTIDCPYCSTATHRV
jgi:DNA-directed RNA polymerase subunit RPC12/RpoP